MTITKTINSKSCRISRGWKTIIVDFFFFFFLLFAIALPVFFESGYLRQVIMLCLSLILFITTFRRNLVFYFSSPIVNCFLLLFVLDFISSLVLELNFFSHAFNDFINIFIILSIFSFIKKRGMIHFSKVSVLPFLLGGPLIGLYQFFTKSFIYEGVASETQSIDILTNAMNSNTNYAALTMLASFALTLYLFLALKNPMFLFLNIISIISVVLTYSRTAMFLMMIVILYTLFLSGLILKDKRQKRIVIILLFLLVAIVFINKNSISSFIGSEDFQLVMANKKTSDFSIRISQWVAAWKSTVLGNSIKHFLFGYGDNSAKAMEYYSGYEMSAHNFIFGQLVCSGFFAFLISSLMYLLIIWKSVKLFKTKHKAEFSFLLSCLTIIFAYLMLSIITYELILCVAIIAALVEKKGFLHETRKTCLYF